MVAVTAVTAMAAAAAVSPPVLEVYGQRWTVRPAAAPTVAATTEERAVVVEHLDEGLTGLLQTVPGVATTDDGSLGGQQRTAVRGASARQTGVFLDAVPLGGGFDGRANIGTVDLFGIEAVDVWRSGAPEVLGAQPIGGAIRLQTRSIERRETQLRAAYGAWNTLHLAGGHTQPLRRGGVLGSVSWRRTDGNFSYRSDNGTAFDPSDDQTLRRGNNDGEQFDGLIKARVEAGDLQMVAMHSAYGFRGGLPGNGLRQPTVADRDERRFISTVALSPRNRPSWSAGMYHAQLRQRQRDPLQEFGIAPNDSDNRAMRLGGWGSASPRSAHGLEWPLALRIDAERYDPNERLSAAPDPPNAVRLATSLRSGLLAPLPGQLVRLSASLGLDIVRSDVARIETFGGQLLVPDPVVRVRPDAHVGADVRPMADLLLRTGYTWAGREPTLFELFGDGAFVLPANQVLRPESAHTLDAGATWTPHLGRGVDLLLDAAAFASWHFDLIQFVRSTSDTFVARNQDGARLLGSEWRLRLAWRQRLLLEQTYDWLDARQKSAQAAEQGKPLPLRARHRGRTAVGWNEPLPRDLSAGAQVRFRIESPHTVDTTGTVRVPGRRQVDLSARLGWREGRLVGEITLYNVMDRQQMDLIAYPLPGRHLMGSLSSRF
ncbi:MAG: TonB-dependent receptor [Candidatus Dadabacteria bacterium]|nr:MAG: TonB-dependent receptor [Candidatus Dadabacteria bacterium]